MKKLLLLTLVLLGGFGTAFADTWTLKGSFDSWGEGKNLTSGTTTLSLTAGEPIQFKVVKNGSTWYGGNKMSLTLDWTVTSISDIVSGDDGRNMLIFPAITGEYTLTLTTENGEPTGLSITSPSGTYEKTTVYLCNTLDWASPYFYIRTNAYYDGTNGSGSNQCPNGIAMSQIGETNIWKAEFPTVFLDNDIAFLKDKQDSYDNFYQTKASVRGDFNTSKPVFVPNTTKNDTKNETDYFNNGYWQYAIKPGKEYTTYVTSDKADFTGLELKAYKATSANASGVVFDEVTTVPANTPLLLKGTPGTLYSVPVAASADDINDNLLVAGDGTTTIGGVSKYDYILSDGKFYRAEEGTVAVGKAYLHLTEAPALAQELSIIFSDDEETDGINAVKGMMPEVIGESYNLAGQKVGANYKGIVIVNGKKVVRK